MNNFIDFTELFLDDVRDHKEEAYSISSQGTGSLTGLDYRVPAHTIGRIRADLRISSLTSEDVKNISDFAKNMLNATERSQIDEIEKKSGSADLSLWKWFAGGSSASASYDKTRSEMKKKGLTDANISEIIDVFSSMAKNMSTVSIDFEVNNLNNDYTVSGSLLLYTIAGSVQTSTETHEFRMLANKGNADGAAAGGDIIPLN